MRKETNITVMGRVSIRDLATVCKYLEEKGIPPKTQSGLLRESVRILADNLPISVDTVEESVEVLKSVGITFNRDTPDDKKVKHAIKLEID